MTQFVAAGEIRAAAEALRGVALATPLVPFPRSAAPGPPGARGTAGRAGSAGPADPPLLVKAESLQPVGSFKLRGAYAAISALPEAERRRGVVAHSSGNHGHAVAYAAALLGVPAAVVVPETAPRAKTDAIRAWGAELVTVAPTMAARQAAAGELTARRGYALIPPYDDRRVIAGQGTIGLEIMAACPETDLIVVPVSGGGLIAGVAAAARSVRPEVTVVGVEPADAADARDSLRKGERVRWPAEAVQRTIADALRVEQVGLLPFAHMQRDVAGIVTVTDAEMLAAVRRLALEPHLIAEPGGAAAVAACLFRPGELPAARRTVAVLSGGNVDPAVLARALGEGGDMPPGNGH